jgi:hypothetical protein
MQLKIRECNGDTVISTMGSHRVADEEFSDLVFNSLPDDYDDLIILDPGEYVDISCDRVGILEAIKLGINLAGGFDGVVHFFDKRQVTRFS